MPHDRAVLHGNSPNFTPTIIINDMNSYAALDIEFPQEERQHGFLVSCDGQTLYWDANKKDFSPEIVMPHI